MASPALWDIASGSDEPVRKRSRICEEDHRLEADADSDCSSSVSDTDSSGAIFLSSTKSDDEFYSSSGPLYPSDTDSESATPMPQVLQPPRPRSPSPMSEMSESLSSEAEEDPLELDRVAKILVSKCGCERECLFHLSADTVLTARKKFLSMRFTEQHQWMSHRIHENSHVIGPHTLETKFLVGGRVVCQHAWCKTHGISHRRLMRVIKSVSAGQVLVEHGNRGVKRPSLRAETARAWMARYFHLVGDKMPHNSQVHLPSWETQKDVYRRFTEDMELQNVPASSIVVLSTFYRIWAEDFSHVAIPEVSCNDMSLNFCK